MSLQSVSTSQTRPERPSTNPTANRVSAPTPAGGLRIGDERVIETDAARLMSRVRRGDVGAFERLVEQYWPRTLAYSRHLSGDNDRAYDITQEAFARLWERRAEWEDTGSVRIWLLRTARNIVISDQRKWKVRALRAWQIAEESRPARTPLEYVESQELSTDITRAIKQLSPRRREAFVLFLSSSGTYISRGVRSHGHSSTDRRELPSSRTRGSPYLARTSFSRRRRPRGAGPT